MKRYSQPARLSFDRVAKAPPRFDVALRILVVWLVTALIGSVISFAGLFLAFLSLPYLAVFAVVSIMCRKAIVIGPFRWSMAAVALTLGSSALMFGSGAALLSLLLSVPAAAGFLVSLRIWPMRA